MTTKAFKPRRPFRFVILGPQGSGKGTQAAFLSRRFGIPALSMGEILRHEVSDRTPFGIRYAKHLHQGSLVPSRLSNAIMDRRIAKPDAKKGFILDGYPRALAQARFLERHHPDTVAIWLHISDELAVARINRRRISPKCGRIYHLDYLRPKRPGICDTCGDRLVQRDDDRPVAVRRRLHIYHKETEPVLRFYHRMDRLIPVNGTPRIPTVRRAVLRAVANYFR